MDACPRSAVLRMAGLLHDVGKPRSRAFSEKTRDYTFYNHESIGAAMANPMLQRLRFSNADRQHIVGLVRHHLICYDESWSDSAVRRWLRRVTPELAEDLYLLGRADAMGKGRDARDDVENIERLRARVEELVAAGAAVGVRDLAISGRDLISKVGLKPGPIMGEILRQLLEEVTEDPQRNETATLLRRAKEIADTASARSN
jgi:tRNA nucleotidyltransferase (CCA-adding enzyme)